MLSTAWLLFFTWFNVLEVAHSVGRESLPVLAAHNQ